MTEPHKRWRIPFIGRGAHSETGGHCYVLGVMVGWLPKSTCYSQGLLEIDILRVLAFRRDEDGWKWSLAKIEFKHAFRPVRWRFGEREANAGRLRTAVKRGANSR